MRHRNALVLAASWLLLFGCGGGGGGPAAPAKKPDAGAADSGMREVDAGHPVTKTDAGKPAGARKGGRPDEID